MTSRLCEDPKNGPTLEQLQRLGTKAGVEDWRMKTRHEACVAIHNSVHSRPAVLAQLTPTQRKVINNIQYDVRLCKDRMKEPFQKELAEIGVALGLEKKQVRNKAATCAALDVALEADEKTGGHKFNNLTKAQREVIMGLSWSWQHEDALDGAENTIMLAPDNKPGLSYGQEAFDNTAVKNCETGMYPPKAIKAVARTLLPTESYKKLHDIDGDKKALCTAFAAELNAAAHDVSAKGNFDSLVEMRNIFSLAANKRAAAAASCEAGLLNDKELFDHLNDGSGMDASDVCYELAADMHMDRNAFMDKWGVNNSDMKKLRTFVHHIDHCASPHSAVPDSYLRRLLGVVGMPAETTKSMNRVQLCAALRTKNDSTDDARTIYASEDPNGLMNDLLFFTDADVRETRRLYEGEDLVNLNENFDQGMFGGLKDRITWGADRIRRGVLGAAGAVNNMFTVPDNYHELNGGLDFDATIPLAPVQATHPAPSPAIPVAPMGELLEAKEQQVLSRLRQLAAPYTQDGIVDSTWSVWAVVAILLDNYQKFPAADAHAMNKLREAIAQGMRCAARRVLFNKQGGSSSADYANMDYHGLAAQLAKYGDTTLGGKHFNKIFDIVHYGTDGWAARAAAELQFMKPDTRSQDVPAGQAADHMDTTESDTATIPSNNYDVQSMSGSDNGSLRSTSGKPECKTLKSSPFLWKLRAIAKKLDIPTGNTGDKESTCIAIHTVLRKIPGERIREVLTDEELTVLQSVSYDPVRECLAKGGPTNAELAHIVKRLRIDMKTAPAGTTKQKLCAVLKNVDARHPNWEKLPRSLKIAVESINYNDVPARAAADSDSNMSDTASVASAASGASRGSAKSSASNFSTGTFHSDGSDSAPGASCAAYGAWPLASDVRSLASALGAPMRGDVRKETMCSAIEDILRHNANAYGSLKKVHKKVADAIMRRGGYFAARLDCDNLPARNGPSKKQFADGARKMGHKEASKSSVKENCAAVKRLAEEDETNIGRLTKRQRTELHQVLPERAPKFCDQRDSDATVAELTGLAASLGVELDSHKKADVCAAIYGATIAGGGELRNKHLSKSELRTLGSLVFRAPAAVAAAEATGEVNQPLFDAIKSIGATLEVPNIDSMTFKDAVSAVYSAIAHKLTANGAPLSLDVVDQYFSQQVNAQDVNQKVSLDRALQAARAALGTN